MKNIFSKCCRVPVMQWKNLTACIALLSMFAACTPRNTVTGNIEGLTNDTVLVSVIPLDGSQVREDTIFAKNGRFEYTFPDKMALGLMFGFPQFYVQNRPAGGLYTPHNSSLLVFACPEEKICIKGSVNASGLDNVILSGSEINRDFSTIQNKLFEIRIHEAKEEMSLEQAMVDKNKEEEEIGWTKRRERNNAARAVLSNYIKQHLNNPLAAHLLCIQPLDSIGMYYDKLGENARNSIFRHMLDEKMEQYLRYKNAMKAKEEVVVSSKAPDFTLEDMDGQPFVLSSLYGQGKYIIIDFWGSWCGPCVVGIPTMKNLYEKYKDKLEILGIACRETSPNSWREAVKQHKLPWINVYDDNLSAVNVKYGIETYPTKFVINPEGTILHIEEGEGENFYKQLERLIK